MNLALHFALPRLALAIYFAACIAAPVHAQDADVREELETGLIATSRQRAELFVSTQEWESLAAHAKKWTREFPGESAAWSYLGRAHYEQNQPQKAVDAFSRAWELSDRKDFRIIESVGDSYVTTKEWELAESAYRTAIALRQRRAELWAKLTDVILLHRAPSWREEAAKTLKKALSFGQYINDHQRWQQYAEILDALNAPLEKQYAAYRHVVRLKVRDAEAWERLYEIEEERGKTDQAEEIADILLRLNSQNAIANLHYGMRALNGGQKTKALEHLNIALKNDAITGPRRSRIYAALGGMYRNPAKALPFYRDAVDSDPSNIGAWEQAIVMLRGLNRRKEAQAVYEQLLAVERKLRKTGTVARTDAEALLNIK